LQSKEYWLFFVCDINHTCRAPARHSSAARPTIVRRAPFYDFAVSYHETRPEQSWSQLRAFIGFDPTFRKATMAQSMHHTGTFVVLVPLQFRHAKPTKIPAHVIAVSATDAGGGEDSY